MRYTIIIIAALAILLSLAALAPGSALAAVRDDGIQNQIILVDQRGHRRDRGDWDHWNNRDRLDRRSRPDYWNRRDRWDDDYRWNRRYYHRPYRRPHYRHRDDWGFFFWGPPLPLPLPPLPPPPHRW